MLAVVNGGPRVKLLLDWAGVEPALRVVSDESGAYGLVQFGRGKASRSVRVGWRDEWRKVEPFKALDCLFEVVEGPAGAIEIELPRELCPARPAESVRVPGTTKQVSLAKV